MVQGFYSAKIGFGLSKNGDTSLVHLLGSAKVQWHEADKGDCDSSHRRGRQVPERCGSFPQVESMSDQNTASSGKHFASLMRGTPWTLLWNTIHTIFTTLPTGQARVQSPAGSPHNEIVEKLMLASLNFTALKLLEGSNAQHTSNMWIHPGGSGGMRWIDFDKMGVAFGVPTAGFRLKSARGLAATPEMFNSNTVPFPLMNMMNGEHILLSWSWEHVCLRFSEIPNRFAFPA